MTTGGEGAAPLSSPPRPFGPCIRNGGEEVNALRYLSKNFEKILTAIILFSMSSFAFINVISRYVVNLSLNFTEELNLYLFVWLAFLGSAWACRAPIFSRLWPLRCKPAPSGPCRPWPKPGCNWWRSTFPN